MPFLVATQRSGRAARKGKESQALRREERPKPSHPEPAQGSPSRNHSLPGTIPFLNVPISNIGAETNEVDETWKMTLALGVCDPVFFAAINDSSKKGDESLSGGVRNLARQGKAKTVPIYGSFWCDIDDPTNFKQAEEYLTSSVKNCV